MTFELLIIFVFGLSIGSFVNVCIYRLPLNKNINKPSSCTFCRNKIKYFDNIPLISFLILKGKCRNCKKNISILYPFIELLISFTAVIIFLKFDFTIVAIFSFLFVVSLIILIFTDYQHFIIPNEITYSFITLGILVSLTNYSIIDLSIYECLIGGLVSGLILFISSKIFFYIKKIEGMGMGDIKMIAMIGFWLGLSNTIFIIILSAFFGSIVGLLLIFIKKMNRYDHIPYGTFIGLTAILIWSLNIFLEFDVNDLLIKY